MKGFDFEEFLQNVREHYSVDGWEGVCGISDYAHDSSDDITYGVNFGPDWKNVLDPLYPHMSLEGRKQEYLMAQQNKKENLDIIIEDDNDILSDLYGNNLSAWAHDAANDVDMTNPDGRIQHVLNSMIAVKRQGNKQLFNDLNSVLRAYVATGYDIYPLIQVMVKKREMLRTGFPDEMKQRDSKTRADVVALSSAIQYLHSAEVLVSPYKKLFNMASELGGLQEQEKALIAIDREFTPEESAQLDAIQDRLAAIETSMRTEIKDYDIDMLHSVIGNKKEAIYLENEGRHGAIDKGLADADLFRGLGTLSKIIHFERARHHQAENPSSEGM